MRGIVVSKEEIQRVLYGKAAVHEIKRVRLFVVRNLYTRPGDDILIRIKQAMIDAGMWHSIKRGRKETVTKTLEEVRKILP